MRRLRLAEQWPRSSKYQYEDACGSLLDAECNLVLVVVLEPSPLRPTLFAFR